MPNFITTKEYEPLTINPTESIRGGNWVGAKGISQGEQAAVPGLVSGFPLTIEGTFGGDGSDGNLLLSDGTTTIDLGGASVFIKNYKTIKIIGSASLAFSNPASTGTMVVLKSLGNVIITSSANPAIDARLLGADGGAGGTGAGANNGWGGGGGASASTNGNTGGTGNTGTGGQGSAGSAYGLWINGVTQTGGESPNGSAASGGTSGSYTQNVSQYAKTFMIPGSGGGGGQGVGGNTGGNGSDGGGALTIECGGKLTITSTINASGEAGDVGGGGNAGGGGGGGGGTIVILYNRLAQNDGTYTVSGGAGGAGAGGGASGGAGANGYSLITQNKAFA